MGIDLTVVQGSLLAAGPDLVDPNFLRSVVLVCQHSPQGAYGLVLNRPSEHTARRVLPQHELLKKSDLRVYVGGPVSLDTMQIVHRAPERISGGVQLTDRLWIGGDLDELGRFALEEPDEAGRKVRLFMGYSGWGEGQLEFELTTGSWLPAPGDVERVFQADTDDMWRSVVGGLGGVYRRLAEEPTDPHAN